DKGLSWPSFDLRTHWAWSPDPAPMHGPGKPLKSPFRTRPEPAGPHLNPSNEMDSPSMNRRTFLKTASLATAAASLPNILRSQGAEGQSPNNRLNIACCGVGGRGYDAVQGLKGENLVAFCDVDDDRASKSYAEFPGVPHFRDFRVMLDKMGSSIDAVTVSTPDHMHFPIAMAAIALGKHVFVEKPLTHTVSEARRLTQAAREKKVATQMGNQGHAVEGVRLLTEWINAGA